MTDMSPHSSPAKGPNEAVEPVFNSLRRLVNAMHSAARETRHDQGVTAAQLFVLSHVRRSPNLSIGALAQLTMTHQSTVSVVVRRLVRRKLLEKRRASDDARRVELTLTSAGRQVVEGAPEVFQLRLLRALESLDPADLPILAAALARLVAGIGAEDAPSGMFFESIDG